MRYLRIPGTDMATVIYKLYGEVVADKLVKEVIAVVKARHKTRKAA